MYVFFFVLVCVHHVVSFCSIFIFYVFFCVVIATTYISTLSLHDALPISCSRAAALQPVPHRGAARGRPGNPQPRRGFPGRDRKSTRLNSSHTVISYAVFCLKKKKQKTTTRQRTQIKVIKA